MVSCTILSRFIPPLACSRRTRTDETPRLLAWAGGVRSPYGVVSGGGAARAPMEHPALPAPILVEPTPRWLGRAGKLRTALRLRLARIGGTPAAYMTGFIAHEQVFARRARGSCVTSVR